ncbi:hypothetical protein LTR62_008481 [Meristemomyces frigidus]|uniref:DUF4048 domain-containing protein n=1 Tax=Meristemomyces frigidus TaxID=1508187 RepID=A0AAN7TMV4_9PEZI|nr:hypothetical protein LTR62_008481 [Meristemomyces frigidus]
MSIAESTSGVSIRSSRFSTSFPVQPSGSNSPTRIAARSPVREGQPVVPESLAAPTGPTDTNFLTAIAAQERRVLELREELQRAEADLNKLKRSWTQHEANKKRNDARRLTQLQPLQIGALASEEERGDGHTSSASMQQEMERRKALINGGRSSNRTLFAGSRHARTLSLLSPGSTEGHSHAGRMGPPLPRRKESLASARRPSLDSMSSTKRPTLMARTSTTPDLTTEVARTAKASIDLSDSLEKSLDHEALLQTGKKMATDFRDGLWTFLDDLRQATVGDEATQHQAILPSTSPDLRRHGSNRTLRSRASKPRLRPSSKDCQAVKTPSPARSKHVKSATQSALPDLADPGFWSEHGVDTATPAVAPVKKSPTVRGNHKFTPVTKVTSITSTDAWDTWEDSSPHPSRSSSTASEQTTTTGPSSTTSAASSCLKPIPKSNPTSKISTGSAIKSVPSTKLKWTSSEEKDPLPWPTLSQFGPATLRRTASHLMSEWEKSLTPSPGKEYRGEGEDLFGLGDGHGDRVVAAGGGGGGGGGEKKD